MTSLALRKKLSERRRSRGQREVQRSENILLQRRIRQAVQREIIKAQRIHVDSQLSSMGVNNPKILELRRNQIMESLGLT